MMRILTTTLALFLGSTVALAEDVAGIKIDKEKKSVTVDAKVAPRKLPNLEQIYPIEVIACWPAPKGKKAHETVLTIDVKPSDVHKAMEVVGLKPGKPQKGEAGTGTGPDVNVFLEIPDAGTTKKVSIHKFLVDPKTKQPFPKSVKFRFTGSIMSKPNPEKDDMVYGADLTGTLIAVYPVTDETVFQTSLTMKEEKYLKLETDPTVLPKEGTPVKIIFEAASK